MAGGVWTPAGGLLGTVREFENFSFSIQYYEETTTTGVEGTTTTQLYYPVTITQLAPQATVTTTIGDPATLSGFYRYIFYDTVIYKDFNDNLVTLQGSADRGTWEQYDPNVAYQIVEFIPDNVRHRTFEFLAEAKDNTGVVISAMNYTIDVSDQNWTPGLLALRNAVQTIRDRGN